jgi:hypothetical protein
MQGDGILELIYLERYRNLLYSEKIVGDSPLGAPNLLSLLLFKGSNMFVMMNVRTHIGVHSFRK